MKYFNWNVEKNQKLIDERGIGFEDVVFYIEQGYLLDELEHPNQERYPGQRILVVDINEYVHLIPYIENDTEIFLKTIIPSRKAMKEYRR